MSKKRLKAISSSMCVLVLCAATIAGAQEGVPKGLTKMEPVICSGNQDIVLKGVYINTDTNGIEARGNCDVELEDSVIRAGGIAVLATGNGEVEVKNSTVEGGQGGLVAEMSGEIEFRGSTVRGGTRASSDGEIVDKGGNQVSGKVSAPYGDTIHLRGDRIEVGDVKVETKGTHTRVETKDAVVDAQGSSSFTAQLFAEDVVVVEDGDTLRIGPASAASTEDNWRVVVDSRYDEDDVPALLEELGAKEVDGRTRLSLAGDVLFAFNSAEIQPPAAAALAKVAQVLRSRADSEILLVGHTDSIGSDAVNQKLSEARAFNVMYWLNQHESIPATLMRAKGMGSASPVAYNTMPDGSDNPAGRAQNRRVEILFESSD